MEACALCPLAQQRERGGGGGRIQAWAAVANPASARVLLKAGFAEERRLRDYLYIPHRNVYEDVIMFGALRSDSAWRQ